MKAGRALHTQATRVRAIHMHYTCVSHTKAKVESKVQLRGETVSLHEDTKPIDIGV